jgi:hypothetical protein
MVVCDEPCSRATGERDLSMLKNERLLSPGEIIHGFVEEVGSGHAEMNRECMRRSTGYVENCQFA